MILSTCIASAAAAQITPPLNSRPPATAKVDTIPAPRDVAYPGTIQLTVDASDVTRGIFRVHERVPVAHAGDLVLLYPKWLPGTHSPAGENFDDVVATLNQVQPYDWRGYLQRKVYGIAPQPPLDGITQGGYRLVFTPEPTNWTKNGEKQGKYSDFTYSAGFTVGEDGKIGSVLWGSPAFNGGLTIGSELVAVNGRKFDGEALKQAIRSAAGNGPAPELLIHSADVYRTVKLDWHGGLRYPHLQKVGTAPGTLDALLAPR